MSTHVCVCTLRPASDSYISVHVCAYVDIESTACTGNAVDGGARGRMSQRDTLDLAMAMGMGMVPQATRTARHHAEIVGAFPPTRTQRRPGYRKSAPIPRGWAPRFAAPVARRGPQLQPALLPAATRVCVPRGRFRITILEIFSLAKS